MSDLYRWGQGVVGSRWAGSAQLLNELIEDGVLVPVDIDYESCDQCGGKIAIIRGRFPYAPDRKVCPTCVVEQLEELVNLFNVPEAAAIGGGDE